MGWNEEETQKTKKRMKKSSIVLLAIILCVLLIIIVLLMVLTNTKQKVFKISVDGKSISNVNEKTLLTTIEETTYINIEKFSKIVGYEYHKGEYKATIIEENKCYVEGKEETASFYLNDNKIYKLPTGKQGEQYQEYFIEKPIIQINGQMYASIEAISKACNVLIEEKVNEFKIYTLDYLIGLYNTNVIKWGYAEIKEQSLENKKALLYGCLVVKKNEGLYKIIDTNNTKEIVLDRYTSIQFLENTQDFFVTDSLNKVGVINIDGTTKIETKYDSISLLSKEYGLYIVKQEDKYGVVSSDGRSVIYPEYDSIGITNSNFENAKSLILNELIPVCKEQKWGAFNKEGKLIIGLEYEEFGYSSNSIQINGVKELVKPLLYIEQANGIIAKKDNKYGLLNVATGKAMIPVVVEGIYAITGEENEDEKYRMLYNGEEMNVIERLIKAGEITKTPDKEETNNMITNTTQNTENQIITEGNNVTSN